MQRGHLQDRSKGNSATISEKVALVYPGKG